MSKYEKMKKEIKNNGVITTTSILLKYGIWPKTTNNVIEKMKRNGYSICSYDSNLHRYHIYRYSKNNRTFL